MMKRTLLPIALGIAIALCGCSVQVTETAVSAPKEKKPEKPLEVIHADDYLCALMPAMERVKAATTTLRRDDEFAKLAQYAAQLLDGRHLNARVKIADVKMKDDHTATVRYSTCLAPAFNAAKHPGLSMTSSGQIDLPMTKDDATQIVPGMILTLQGKATYEHRKQLNILELFLTTPFMIIHYSAGSGQSGAVLFSQTGFRIDPQ